MSRGNWKVAERERSADLADPVLRTVVSSVPAGEWQLFEAGPEAMALTVRLPTMFESASAEVEWSEPGPREAQGQVVCVSATASDAEIRSLLELMQAGELAAEPPAWALAGPGRSSLSAYRAAGPTAVVRMAGERGSELRLALFPIRLSALAAQRRSLTPEHKLPEGPDDNLDRRQDWFQDRRRRDG